MDIIRAYYTLGGKNYDIISRGNAREYGSKLVKMGCSGCIYVETIKEV